MHKNVLPYCSRPSVSTISIDLLPPLSLISSPDAVTHVLSFFFPSSSRRGVNINESNDAQKDELSTGSASPSSSNSLDIPEVQTTTTSSLIKSRATNARSKDARNRLAAHSLLLARQQSNDSPHDDLERNIPVTLIDHETGLKR